MKFLIITLCLLYGQIMLAQDFAVVVDKDGYVNVRDENMNIIDQLPNEKAVFYYLSDNDWYNVEYSDGKVLNDGIIHRSRLKDISSYDNIPLTKAVNNEVELTSDSIKIIIQKEKFLKDDYHLTYDKYGYLDKINNKVVWGTDGNIPKEKYKKIEAIIGNQTFSLPSAAIENLFEPNLDYTKAYYNTKEKKLYLSTMNGDGAGGYVVLWVFKNGVYQERIVTYGF